MKDKGEGSKTDRTVAPGTLWSRGVTSVTSYIHKFRYNHKQKQAPREEVQVSKDSRPLSYPVVGEGGTTLA